MAKRRRRQRRVYLNITLLLLLLASLLSLYVVLQQVEQEKGTVKSPQVQTERHDAEALFPLGQAVQLVSTAVATSEGQSLVDLLSQVGQVVATEELRIDGQTRTIYRIRYGADWEIAGIFEEDLRAVDTPYTLGQEVALVSNVTAGFFEDGLVTGISSDTQEGQNRYIYTAEFPSLGQVSGLLAEDFVTQIALPLVEDNSPAENDRILRQALEKAKNNPATRIDFPTGRFVIGSQTPVKDYQILTSNLELRGHDTTLVVNGSARWFGLATGPAATEGLSNFAMSGLTIEARDLSKGNQFIIMANHGNNWQVSNNRFTMVHQMSSHVFDLGGVQNAVFTGNVFEGYAPELTTVTELGNYTTHNIIAEAIQFDAASNNGEWDGGMIKAIDPNYMVNNSVTAISHNLTLTDNSFLPYLDRDGQLVAYGASIGQHSSGVGYVTIVNNVFSETVLNRFKEQLPAGESWLLEPIHLQSNHVNTIYGNYFD